MRCVEKEAKKMDNQKKPPKNQGGEAGTLGSE
jgi:hypothetical protein